MCVKLERDDVQVMELDRSLKTYFYPNVRIREQRQIWILGDLADLLLTPAKITQNNCTVSSL